MIYPSTRLVLRAQAGLCLVRGAALSDWSFPRWEGRSQQHKKEETPWIRDSLQV